MRRSGEPTWLLRLWAVCGLVVGASIDNHLLQGKPQLWCGSDSIRVTARTSAPFRGRLYVKGHSKETECHFKSTQHNQVAELTLQFGTCGLDRKRTHDGVTVAATVIVSFHPLFETEADGAFRLQCVYRTQSQTLRQTLHGVRRVVHAARTWIPMPTCRYEVGTVVPCLNCMSLQILDGGPHGRPIHSAENGTTVYHKWACHSTSPDQFCVRVHSCVAQSPNGGSLAILDWHGCVVGSGLLQDELDYGEDLSAGQLAQVSRMADQASIYFQCQILVARKKGDGPCARPQCAKTQMDSVPEASTLSGQSQRPRDPRSLQVRTDLVVRQSGVRMEKLEVMGPMSYLPLVGMALAFVTVSVLLLLKKAFD